MLAIGPQTFRLTIEQLTVIGSEDGGDAAMIRRLGLHNASALEQRYGNSAQTNCACKDGCLFTHGSGCGSVCVSAGVCVCVGACV